MKDDLVRLRLRMGHQSFQWISAALFVSQLYGCVAYPTTRTYFEPNASDGKPVPSRSCGYHAAKNDALIRNIPEVHIQVSPHFTKSKPISVSVLFQYVTGRILALEPGLFELHSLSDGKVFKPLNVKTSTQYPDRSHPYFSEWIHLAYAPTSDDLNSIAIVFPKGAVVVRDIGVELKPFRFQRVEKSDFYYSSINC